MNVEPVIRPASTKSVYDPVTSIEAAVVSSEFVITTPSCELQDADCSAASSVLRVAAVRLRGASSETTILVKDANCPSVIEEAARLIFSAVSVNTTVGEVPLSGAIPIKGILKAWPAVKEVGD